MFPVMGHRSVPSASVADILRTGGMVLLTVAGLIAAAPVQAGGDLGRRDDSISLDQAVDTIAAWLRPGAYHLDRSDEEVDMANRLWRFVAPEPRWNWLPKRQQTLRPGRRLWLGDASGEDRYYRWLHAAAYQSSAVRYATVSDDITADLGTLPGAFRSVCAVVETDHRRALAEEGVPALEAHIRNAVASRAADNRAEIDVFVWALGYRYDSYSYALDHLLVDTPDPAARDVSSMIEALRPWVERAEAGRFCSRAGHPGSPHLGDAAPDIPSRYARGNPPSGNPAKVGSGS